MSKIEIEKPELILIENDLAKKSSYFITSKKNFDFVSTKLTWKYFERNKT